MNQIEPSEIETPHKGSNDTNQLLVLESIEKELETFSHLLEKSSDKEKVHLAKIGEQAEMIHNLNIENQTMLQENQKLKNVLENYMKNFDCFMGNLKRTADVEKENIELKKQLDSMQSQESQRNLELLLEIDGLKKQVEEKDSQVTDLKTTLIDFEEKYTKLNTYIKENFEKTITFKHIRKIEELENLLDHRKDEIHKLNSQLKRGKNDSDKAARQKEIELELLKLDYHSALTHNKSGNKSNKNSVPNSSSKSKQNKTEESSDEKQPKPAKKEAGSRKGRKPSAAQKKTETVDEDDEEIKSNDQSGEMVDEEKQQTTKRGKRANSAGSGATKKQKTTKRKPAKQMTPEDSENDSEVEHSEEGEESNDDGEQEETTMKKEKTPEQKFKMRTRNAYNKNKTQQIFQQLESSDNESIRESYEPEDPSDESFGSDDESEDFRPRKNKKKQPSQKQAAAKKKAPTEKTEKKPKESGVAKRKASEKAPSKKPELKKPKKSENKDLIIANRNMMQYHLLN